MNGGSATPFGVFGIAIDSSAGNGSAQAYYGDLEFQLTRTSGLSTDDFITNAAIDPGSAGPAYFAADLTNGSTSGSQAWLTRTVCTDCASTQQNEVPEPGSLAMLGSALVGLYIIRRRQKGA